ncbi:MAG: hypothetical protein ACI8RZ_006175 [Myxococcota bacterium]|jgi:hypothetical protein
MAFQKMHKPDYPPRHWSIVGYPSSGKTTFAAQMRGPKLVIDADHRFTEVLDLDGDDVYALSDNPADNVDPDAIGRILEANMPGSGVKTIVVDSLTAIITPFVVQAMVDRQKGRAKNLMAAFQKKALAMRQLQDAVTRWGTDSLWIYHLQDSRDANAASVVRSTVSQTEIARLTRSINLQLQVVEDGGRRGIQVIWARRGRCGITVWDDVGMWVGMPEKLEAAIYDGLTQNEQANIEAKTPKVFPNSETAISWGFEQEIFPSIEAARRVYMALKLEASPRSAREMAALWVAEVRTRQAAEPLADEPLAADLRKAG